MENKTEKGKNRSQWYTAHKAGAWRVCSSETHEILPSRYGSKGRAIAGMHRMLASASIEMS